MGKKIKAFGIKRFQQMDDGMHDQTVPKYYKAKYGKPYHLVALLQVRGNIPTIKKKRPVEIDEELSSIPGINIMPKYFSCLTTPKLKRVFGNDIFPKPEVNVRQHIAAALKYNPLKSGPKKSDYRKLRKVDKVRLHEGICIECYSRYTVDILKHPANLCVCLECSPHGVAHGSYGVHSIQMKRHGMSAKS